MIKVSVATDDGTTVSQHFGQALYFKIYSLDNSKVVAVEMRDKAHHSHSDHSQDQGQGIHPGQLMIEAISDCQVLICGGMGMPAYNRALNAGMQVFLTNESDIEAAIKAYQSGKLVSEPGLIHHH